MREESRGSHMAAPITLQCSPSRDLRTTDIIMTKGLPAVAAQTIGTEAIHRSVTSVLGVCTYCFIKIIM